MTESTLQTRHPTLDQVIGLALESLSERLRVCMPGQIQTYDASTGLATVQPGLLIKYRGRAQPVPLPVIGQVPVVMPRTAAGGILFPLAAGDPVLLVFADRSIAAWVQGDGSPKAPSLAHKHDLTDCFAIPGAYPQTKPLQAQFPKALEIHLNNNTPFAVSNGQVELLDLINQLITQMNTVLQQIQAITVNVPPAPVNPVISSVPINSQAFQNCAQAIQQIQQNLAQLKAK
jgi:Phage protein Gp138 N-terminal domain